MPLPSWPSVKFFPDVPVRRILDHVQSQHFAMTYGNFVEELEDLCRLLDIRAIVDAWASEQIRTILDSQGGLWYMETAERVLATLAQVRGGISHYGERK